MHIPDIVPGRVTIFGFETSETVITAIGTTLVIFVLLLLFRYILLKKFETVPKGLQNLLELVVSGVTKFSEGTLGDKGKGIAPFILTLFGFIICSGLVEYMGLRPPATDLNCTVALAFMSFILMIAYGIRYKGFGGWIKSYGHPKAFIAPFNVISFIVIPISLACRMFGNLFSGLVVMDMIYSAMGYFAIVVPAFASLYFVLFHLAMQSYVFSTLTLSFIKERIE
ncbi:MAG: FoF1 ATP synthase subunit A [Christensenellaceae bacterium]|jgi:F-type H+-transporting ATPase subunit a